MEYKVVMLNKKHEIILSVPFYGDFYKALNFMTGKKELPDHYCQMLEAESNRVVVSMRLP